MPTKFLTIFLLSLILSLNVFAGEDPFIDEFGNPKAVPFLDVPVLSEQIDCSANPIGKGSCLYLRAYQSVVDGASCLNWEPVAGCAAYDQKVIDTLKDPQVTGEWTMQKTTCRQYISGAGKRCTECVIKTCDKEGNCHERHEVTCAAANGLSGITFTF